MQKTKTLLFISFFIISGLSVLFVFSSYNTKQILAENSLNIGDEIEVPIVFNSSVSKVGTAGFQVNISSAGELLEVRCGEGGSFNTALKADTNTSCALVSLEGVNSGTLAVVKLKAKSSGNLTVTLVPLPQKDGIFRDTNATYINDVVITPISYVVVDNSSTPPASDPASCFGDAEIYQKSPYEYKVNEIMKQGDWVAFPINPQCRNKQVLESIFGPLDEINNGTVLITKPNQEFQYGFTFNRIVAIDGYNTDEILAGQPDQTGLTEQQLNDLHYSGKDTQSIENCDYNAAQMVFDLVNNVAKPNMADYKPVATGYYQFDITPKFKCDENNPNQQSLGAGFVRVTDKTTPPAVEVVCKGLTGIAYTPGCDLTNADNTNVCYFSLADQSIPKDFVGKVNLTCEGKSKGKDINSISFRFLKDNNFVGSEEWMPADTIVPTECNETETADGYKCVVGSATFDVSGQGTYSASSKVCIVEGDTKTCSPNANN